MSDTGSFILEDPFIHIEGGIQFCRLKISYILENSYEFHGPAINDVHYSYSSPKYIDLSTCKYIIFQKTTFLLIIDAVNFFIIIMTS